MPVVFVISEEWMLRAGVRAELRELGIKTLGMDTAADVGTAIADGESPSVVVVDANARAASDPAVRQLMKRIPAILIAPRTTKNPFASAANVLFRPIQIREIVAAVLELAKGLST